MQVDELPRSAFACFDCGVKVDGPSLCEDCNQRRWLELMLEEAARLDAQREREEPARG